MTAAIDLSALFTNLLVMFVIYLFELRRSSAGLGKQACFAGPSTKVVSTDSPMQAQFVESAQLAEYLRLYLLQFFQSSTFTTSTPLIEVRNAWHITL